MANITTEQALQIPQQLKRQNPHSGGGQTLPREGGDESGAPKKGILSDDAVTIRQRAPQAPIKKIDVKEYKSELGNDAAFVRETLKNKLAEYRLSPHTPLSVSKDVFGNLEIKGPVLQTELEKIKSDLEKSQAFMESFNRVSQQQPTLNYVDNVVKIAKAYGVSNNLFDTLVSEDKQFNGLNDIAHRYQAMRASNTLPAEGLASEHESFQFVVN